MSDAAAPEADGQPLIPVGKPPCLIDITDPASDRCYQLGAGRWLIGKSVQCEIMLAGEGVAERHLRVVVGDEDGVQVEALAVTEADGKPLEGVCALARPTELKLGSARLRAKPFDMGDVATMAVVTKLKPIGSMVVKTGNDEPQVYELTPGSHLVGRHKECDINLAILGASRKHFRLVVTKKGLELTDLGSKNGTLYEGLRIEGTKPVPWGEAIAIGESTIEFKSDASLAPTPQMDNLYHDRITAPGIVIQQQNPWTVPLVLLVVIGALGAGAYLLRDKIFPPQAAAVAATPDGAQQEDSGVAVAVPTAIEGVVEAKRFASLTYPIDGRIKAVSAKLDRDVKQDKVVIDVYNRDIGKQVAQAKRNLDRQIQLRRQGLVLDQDVEAAQQEYTRVAEQLEGSRIRAPFDGKVVQLEAKVGDLAVAGSVAIAIADLSELYVRAVVEGAMIRGISQGTEVVVSIDGVDESVAGKVESVALAADPNLGGFPLRIKLVLPPKGVRVGLAASIELPEEAPTE
jgi:multidrug efflux pump subunit AcrA (membrane-fusion protein)